MSFTVYLRPEAEANIDEAAAWYEGQCQSLGQDSLSETLNVCNRISENPWIYPVVHKETRRAVIHRFPFAIFYRVEEDAIVVVAVMHGSRHPRHWKQRT